MSGSRQDATPAGGGRPADLPRHAFPRFDSVLIANRGEIALRVLRSARRLGYRVIAVHSDADTGAAHVLQADQAVRIGTAAPRDSYLNIDALLAAARTSGAQAVHPGYGFLAENEVFAQAVLDAGLVWIGPSPAAIRAMGDKARARQLMEVAGVPCVPGYDGELQDDTWLRAQAEQIGLPLMIKATAGGGGRGMRLVRDMDAFDAALAAARSEARTAFGSATVLLERAIEEPRHVEIQVFADEHGHVVHLGERDCSVQRRHQKLIEEAPSPALQGEDGWRLRRRMGDMAVAAARAIDYRGAGTIECLLDPLGQFYFMEMNTRLQVEHPVTEALTGYDLVEWQLRVAQGEHLPETSQEAILQRFESGGHAIEVRLCAEDPAGGFLPQSGRLLRWQAPQGLRVEHALGDGVEIAPFYDSMVAKLVAQAPDREAAIGRLVQGLRETVALGVRTNQSFLIDSLRHPAFAAGAATTGFVASHGAEVLAAGAPPEPALCALLLYAARAVAAGQQPQRVRLPLAWALPMRLLRDGEALQASLTALGGGRYRVQAGGVEHAFELREAGAERLVVVSSAGRVSVDCAWDDGVLHAAIAGRTLRLEDRTLAAAASSTQRGAGQVRSPMAGRIVQVAVEPGQQVAAGAPLVVLEAMKMEHPSFAPFAATVREVLVKPGAQVSAGSLLVALEPSAPASPA